MHAFLHQDQFDHGSCVLGHGVGHAQDLGEQIENLGVVTLRGDPFQGQAPEIGGEQNDAQQLLGVRRGDAVVGGSHEDSGRKR
ncbi:hypothetical protein D3C78_1676010 [compost metagenome]